jgi:lactoylglutathione lyase
MAAENSTVGAAGIGVSDLARSVDFYTRVLGMRQLMKLNLPQMEEVVVGYSGRGTSVALMHWTDGAYADADYRNLPVKLVLTVPDPASVAAAIREEGLEVIREPAPVPELGGVTVGFARDPDGYVIELLQARAPVTPAASGG